MTKKLWHDVKEEPVLGSADYVRIACLVEFDISWDVKARRIDTIRIYQPDQWTVPWPLTVKENHIVKWAYFDDLISNQTFVRTK